MKLPNTKRYYCDMAHYYFQEGRVHLMSFFRTLANPYKYEHSATDTRNWFEQTGTQRPQKDPVTGLYEID